MSTEAREHRRLAIAAGLITDALPRARTDRNFPIWASRTLSGDRRFGSRDRRYYRELIYTAIRFLPWVESVCAEGRGLAALWLSADTADTADARAALAVDRGPADLPLAERATAFNKAFAGANASPDSLVPDWVRDECPGLLTPNEAAIIHSRAPLWLRAARSAPAEAIAALAEEGIGAATDDRLPGAIRVLKGPDVTRTGAYADGFVEVQDIGSQWVLYKAGVTAGERWLDACAGAGGKTLQLASLVDSGTPVVAHDIRAAALDELKGRAARAGINSIRVAGSVDGEFDAVLVDAPCSGSGTWRRSPHLKWQTTRTDLAKFATRQLDLLRRFAKHVRPGGRLVYATCSLARAENEGTVRAFLAADPRFAPATPGPDALGTTLLPSVLDSDGFFVAVLRRNRVD